jgi:hypothetical protein
MFSRQGIALSILLFLFSAPILAYQNSDGYRITVHIAGSPDTLCYLASYYGDKTYLIDTAFLNVKGDFIFQGDTTLPSGMYILAGEKKNKLFDFIITGQQTFRLATDTGDMTGHMKAKGSWENTLFFKYIQFIAKKKQEVSRYDSILNTIRDDYDSVKRYQIRIKKIDVEVKDYQNNLIFRNGDTFIARFMAASLEPQIPEYIFSRGGNTDSAAAFRYYKKHYWDNFDLKDDRLLRTPLFQEKFDGYFNRLVLQQPDSVMAEADKILAKCRVTSETYKYLLWHFITTSEKSNIMGMDAVFVHMVKKYIEPQHFDWLNETVRKNLIDRANVLNPLLIGKPAPLMILLDTNDVPVSLYNIRAKYTIVFFWEKDCGHCQKEMPVLKDFYNSSHDSLNFEVYAVCIDTSVTAWKSYIREHDLDWINVNGYRSLTPDFHDLYDIRSSPVMYLLDENKVIIAKRILTDQIRDILEMKNDK